MTESSCEAHLPRLPSIGRGDYGYPQGDTVASTMHGAHRDTPPAARVLLIDDGQRILNSSGADSRPKG